MYKEVLRHISLPPSFNRLGSLVLNSAVLAAVILGRPRPLSVSHGHPVLQRRDLTLPEELELFRALDF